MRNQVEAGVLPLAGLEVAIAGRLASMTRDEARVAIEGAGGSYRPRPGEGTALLVVGGHAPPLARDGRLPRSLERARRLQAEGRPIQVVPEEELLVRLGRDPEDHLRRLYTGAQLARMLGVSPRLLRAWVRHGLIHPARVVRRLAFFEFAQVASARALHQLTQGGVTPARIARSLRQAVGWLPEASRALAQLERLEQEPLLCVRTEDGRLAEPSGQLRLEFAAPPEAPAPLALRPPPAEPAEPAEREGWPAWFERGVHLEEQGRFARAAEAYEAALEAGGAQPEALFNLGNVLYALGRKEEAAARFAQALEADTAYVEAWNNLGIVLGELDDAVGSLSAYRRALALEPVYADAHYNLAEALAAQGQVAEARRHWRAYLAQDPSSPWADTVRERLGERSGR